METNEEKEGVRQESEVVSNESTLVKDKETERQEETESVSQIVESKPNGHA